MGDVERPVRKVLRRVLRRVSKAIEPVQTQMTNGDYLLFKDQYLRVRDATIFMPVWRSPDLNPQGLEPWE